MTVLHGPDDVAGPERRVAAEEHLRPGRLEGLGIHLRHAPLVELDPQIALDPRKRIFLADRQDDIVGRDELFPDDALGGDPALGVDGVFHVIEAHSGELAVLDHEGFRGAVDDDLDALLLRVFQLPFGSLEETAWLASHYLHGLGA